VKTSFDISGLSRNDIPTDRQFFGDEIMSSACYHKYKDWARDPGNTFIQGTFSRGADPKLFYMLAQAMRYLMRSPQPWFRRMLLHHLPLVGFSPLVVSRGDATAAEPPATEALVYVQERGEIAKFREYYNVFGCHNINSSMFLDYVENYVCRGRDPKRCAVYISGNTPLRNYEKLKRQLEHNHHRVLSTWAHPMFAAKTSETERWGASAPALSWVDLFAGAASTSWICVVQSNWCRVVNFLRLTGGRARCRFIDGGAIMVSSVEEREKYCIVGPYPTKAFSNRVR
jgi:hypothetical protein